MNSPCVLGGAGGHKRSKNLLAHPLLDADAQCWQSPDAQIQSSPKLQGIWDPSLPFIVSNFDGPFKDDALTTRLAEFGALFKQSNYRVTEGRAHAPLAESLAAALPSFLYNCLPSEQKISPHTISTSAEGPTRTLAKLEADDAASHPDLSKMMIASSFGIASSHVSIGKFELNQFPCLRATWKGTRFITIVLFEDALMNCQEIEKETPVSLQKLMDWAHRLSPSDISKLVAKGGAFAGTIGPSDLLYTPAGAIVSHKVLGDDVIGVRMGVLGGTMDFDKLLEVTPANKALSQASTLLAKKRGSNREAMVKARALRDSPGEPPAAASGADAEEAQAQTGAAPGAQGKKEGDKEEERGDT